MQSNSTTSKVYVINRSGHDYSDAHRFGRLVFLTEGKIKQLEVNNLYRDLCDKLQDSTPNDYLLLTSMPILSSLAASILAAKHHKLNLLLYKAGRYIERNIVIEGVG